jgi:hypothetical protein
LNLKVGVAMSQRSDTSRGSSPVLRPTPHTILVLGLVFAVALVLAGAVAQIIDYELSLRSKVLDWDTHRSLFGALSLLASFAVATCAFCLARVTRSRETSLLAGVLVLIFVLRVVHPSNVLLISIPFLGAASVLLWRLRGDAGRGEVRVIGAGLVLLACSYVIHLGGAAALAQAGDGTVAWADQTRIILKHATELAGWMLVATGLLAMAADGSRRRRSVGASSRGNPTEGPGPADGLARL